MALLVPAAQLVSHSPVQKAVRQAVLQEVVPQTRQLADWSVARSGADSSAPVRCLGDSQAVRQHDWLAAGLPVGQIADSGAACWLADCWVVRQLVGSPRARPLACQVDPAVWPVAETSAVLRLAVALYCLLS